MKTFNTVYPSTWKPGGWIIVQAVTARDHQQARSIVLDMGSAVGFDAVDAGPLSNARQLESLGYFNIQLGYVLGNGTNAGLKFIH